MAARWKRPGGLGSARFFVKGAAALLLCGLWALRCPAQLRFETTAINVVAAGQEVMVAEFPFEIGPAGRVIIAKVEPDCSCTVGSLDKTAYEPGEKGRVKLEFRVGEAAGPQEKRLAITASDQAQPHILTLTTDLPRIFDFSPRTVYWDHAAPPAEKIVTFQVAANGPAMVSVRAESDQPSVSVSVAETIPGKQYLLRLKPTATDQVLVAKIKIATTDAGRVERSFVCFAMVKPLPEE